VYPFNNGCEGQKALPDPFKITQIRALEILDSRGNPTVQVEVFTGGGFGRAAVPSGASTGQHEALELRDGDKARYGGKGVLQAVKNVETVLAPAVVGQDCREQRRIDETLIRLDGTPYKSRLGANAILGVSLAVAVAAAATSNQPLYTTLRSQKEYVLPVPMMNIINGAKHAGNQLSIQEFQVMPTGFSEFPEALRAGVETYHTLGALLQKQYGVAAKNLGDEGGFAPPMSQTRDALNVIVEAIEGAGYKPGKDLSLGIDAAASEFFKDGIYSVDGRRLTVNELHEYYRSLCKDYPLVSIEDPFEDTDFASFAALTKVIGKSVQIVGDDLFTSNTEWLQRGIDIGAANALLLKVNQIGTLSQALDAADLALKHGYSVVVSHRSGETEDTFIADLAVSLSCGQIKTGAPARTDRTAKYNRLLSIARELGSGGGFAGRDFRLCGRQKKRAG
jgi:enolase